jgi:Na+/melibiose symporter and related transporters
MTEATEVRTLRTYTKKEAGTFLTSMAGQNMLITCVSACLAYYMQFTVLIPAVTVGIILTVAQIWDGINDPIMGVVVDRTRSKYGKCIPWLRVVPLPIALFTLLCFTNFGLYTEASHTKQIFIALWAALTYIMWDMFYTVGDIPLWGITSLMSEDEKDRNKLIGWARVAGGVGGGVVMFTMQSLAFAIRDRFSARLGNDKAEMVGFFLIALVFCVIGGAMFQIVGYTVKERVTINTERLSVRNSFRTMFKNKPFRQMMVSGILCSPRSIIQIVAMPIVSYYFADKNALKALMYLGLLGGGLFIGQFVAMVLTPGMVKKIPKKKLYNLTNLFLAVVFILLFAAYLICDVGLRAKYGVPANLTHPLAVAILFILFSGCGLGLGVLSVLQTLMVLDAVNYEEYTNGNRPDGVFISGLTFLGKLSAGIASAICAVCYGIVNFSDVKIQEVNDFIASGGTPRTEPKYQIFMFILFFLISVPPAIGSLLAIIPTIKYALDDKELEKILAALNEKRHLQG